MNRKARRAFERQYFRQLEDERNGAPVPPEIAAMMTKPREDETLFQVGVTSRLTKKVHFLGPMMSADACGISVEDINKQILGGQRRDWSHAAAFPMTRVQGVY